MSLENFNQEIIYQIDNEIFNNPEGNVPQENEGFYSIFLFTKYNSNQNEEWIVDDWLTNDWIWCGASWIGDWRENQFYGSGPLDLVYQNEMNLRSKMNEYLSRGILLDFKIRYVFPQHS